MERKCDSCLEWFVGLTSYCESCSNKMWIGLNRLFRGLPINK